MQRLLVIRRGVIEMLCLVMMLTACIPTLPITQPGTPSKATVVAASPTSAPTLPLPNKYNQSPDLKKLADQGKLPAVKDRLPEKPKVVPTVEQTGVYGGRWQMVIRPSSDQEQFIRTVAYEPLMRWTSDYSGVEPNLVDRYTVNNNATDYTFFLRKGIRWSDGEPFTTGDIRFWYNDVLLNKTLVPNIPGWLLSGERVAEFKFVSDVEFQVHFASTNALFLQRLATPEALMITAFPAHYAQKFHGSYVPEAEMNRLIYLGGYKTWQEMFINRIGIFSTDEGNFVDPDRPRLSAWVLKNAYLPDAPSIVWERNPYYWKVDPEGNQLPYLDAVIFNSVNSVDEIINRLSNGGIDMQDLPAISSAAWIGLKKDMQGNLYRTFSLQDTSNNVMVIHLNLIHQNIALRQVFQNLHFRMGLSYAIDRQEIVNMIYQGKGKPWQAAPRADSPFYNEQMATQYTKYSIDEANKYLDLSGFKKDTLGRRIGPDGRPIAFKVQVPEGEPDLIAMLNVVARDWAMVGIDMKPEVLSLSVFKANIHDNTHDAAVSRGGASSYYDVLLNPANYMPFSDDSYFGVGWANYYNKVHGYEAISPDSATYSQMRMYDLVIGSINTNDRLRYMNSVVQFAGSTLKTIGIALGPDRFGVVKEKFRNVPSSMPSSWSYPNPAPTNPEQYFIQ